LKTCNFHDQPVSIVAHWRKEKEKVTVNPRILKAPKIDLTYIYEVPNF
jgi:hypothetical protein